MENTSRMYWPQSSQKNSSGRRELLCVDFVTEEGALLQMKKTLLKAVLIFIVFFIGACSVVALDTICFETTGQGGKLVLDVDN